MTAETALSLLFGFSNAVENATFSQQSWKVLKNYLEQKGFITSRCNREIQTKKIIFTS